MESLDFDIFMAERAEETFKVNYLEIENMYREILKKGN